MLNRVGASQMGDDIVFYENVFKETFCKYLFQDSLRNLSSSREFSRSNFHWESKIVRMSAPVLVRDYDTKMSAIILQQLHDKGVINKNYNNYHVMNYVWTRLSYIPWHNDGDYMSAITVYLNEYWDPNWGVIYVYRTSAEPKQNIRGYLPKFNAAVKNNNRVSHSTTMISMDAASPRVTIQLFTKTGSN
jgi:hypothetical protein